MGGGRTPRSVGRTWERLALLGQVAASVTVFLFPVGASCAHPEVNHGPAPRLSPTGLLHQALFTRTTRRFTSKFSVGRWPF